MILGLTDQHLAYGGHRVLANVTLHVEAGERVALIGPSGAGKSTLLHALYQQVAGQAALCPQQYGLVDSLSVYNNIYMAQLDQHCALYNLWNLVHPIASHRRAVARLAEQLGLGSLLDRSVDSLSGGQQQRVALARAMYRRQSIFLGDEPVASLDPLQGPLLLELAMAQHATSVVALHNRQLACELFDRVIAVRDGSIWFDLPVARLEPAQLEALYAG